MARCPTARPCWPRSSTVRRRSSTPAGSRSARSRGRSRPTRTWPNCSRRWATGASRWRSSARRSRAPTQTSSSSGPRSTSAGSSSSTSRRCGSPTGSRSSASRRSDPCWPTGGSSRRPRRSPDVALLTVVALGGNALLRPGQRGTAAEHRANLAATFRAIAPLLAGEVVLTHGNGPQVGNELLRQELAAAEAPPLPLWVAVAQTQAEIGTLAAAELRPVVGRPVAVVATHVVVAEDDPAFDHPTKPIGPFYDSGHAQALQSDRGWMPVVVRDGRYDGVDAVIDKDHASALLATGLGAERLVILTQVSQVYRGFGTEEEKALSELRPGRDDDLVPELAAGSMRPKVEAAFAFVARTGGEALITSAG